MLLEKIKKIFFCQIFQKNSLLLEQRKALKVRDIGDFDNIVEKEN